MRADLVRLIRTIWFQEERILDAARLNDLIDPARLGGSARNGQALNSVMITEARFAGHDEHRRYPVLKHSLSRMLMTPPVAV